MAGVVDASGAWDGVYLGGFVGYGAGTISNPDFPDTDMDGFLVGANVGANFTLTEGIVAGIVGDLAWTDINGEDGSFSLNIDWLGSVRGNLGFDAGSFMPYLTAGLAFAGVTADFSGTSDSNTHIGWTVGAGVAVAVSDDLSLDLLYRYSDLGEQDYDLGGPTDAPEAVTVHTVQVGLNWKF